MYLCVFSQDHLSLHSEYYKLLQFHDKKMGRLKASIDYNLSVVVSHFENVTWFFHCPNYKNTSVFPCVCTKIIIYMQFTKLFLLSFHFMPLYFNILLLKYYYCIINFKLSSIQRKSVSMIRLAPAFEIKYNMLKKTTLKPHWEKLVSIMHQSC